MQSTHSKLTQAFLTSIAQHLSSRAECRGVNYRIAIGVNDPQIINHNVPENCITFIPNIYVFPDRYHRKDTDKIPIVYHVASAHYSDNLSAYQKEGYAFIDTANLVPGVYEYQSSIDNKKRRWVRLESL